MVRRGRAPIDSLPNVLYCAVMSPLPPYYKICPRCERALLAELEFHFDLSRRDGYRGYCKDCNKELQGEWRLRTGVTKKRAAKPYRERV